MTIQSAPPELVRYRTLGPRHPWRQRGLDMFRAFIDEQAKLDPIYGWNGGDDQALQRTWGGWGQLHLFVPEPEAEPSGLVSWTSDSGLPPIGVPSGLPADVAQRSIRSVTLTNLYLAPHARGRQLGPRLVRALLALLSADPPLLDLAGERRPASVLLASTHGWNHAAQRCFSTAGLEVACTTYACDHAARGRPPAGHLTVSPTSGRLDAGELVVDEWAGPRAPLEVVSASEFAPTASASLYALHHGILLRERAAPMLDEAVYRVVAAGETALVAAFSWSLASLPRQVVVRCTELHARADALARPGLIAALHALLLARIDRVLRKATRRGLDRLDRILRLPLLVPAVAERALAPALTQAGLNRELIHYAAPLS